jgi:signal transduction histidine kinase
MSGGVVHDTVVSWQEQELAQLEKSEVKRVLARELHDSISSVLTAMVVDVESFGLDQASLPRVAAKVAGRGEPARQAIRDLGRRLRDLRDVTA